MSYLTPKLIGSKFSVQGSKVISHGHHLIYCSQSLRVVITHWVTRPDNYDTHYLLSMMPIESFNPEH